MAAAAARCSSSRTTTASRCSRSAPARCRTDYWFVTEGLKAGDKVVVEGFQKFAAGDKVKPQSWSRSGRRGRTASARRSKRTR